MRHGWNPAKSASNLAKHGVAFDAAEKFDWTTALVQADTREDYGETRMVAFGAIGDRLHVLVFTIRRELWIISLRRASRREVRHYAREG